ncbi:MAG: hypothetical protein QG604_245 [Candidatus Dependentiae bacterium]|nr:hypothetical protein [Candidatus Dependentiae bacterium]
MICSSYYISSLDQASRPFSEPFLVVGHTEGSIAPQLVANAVASGIKTVVMEREKAGVYRRPCQNDLLSGVLYFFVRSLPATLSRWQAVPFEKGSSL